MRKLPIGIQSFEKLISDNFLYVDKTEYVYQLVHNNVPYFLSRPRRFGKSLLLSTLCAYYEGKRDLFRGFAIEKLEEHNPNAWQPYPVFYFDFNGQNYNDTPLEDVLSNLLREWEVHYGSLTNTGSLGERFEKLLILACKQVGRKCVVLVDEYDKPLLETIENLNLEEHNRAVFKSFFSVLKKADAYLQFVFITGVTKFNKVSIFSDLNQLNDISLNEAYSGLCGITEEEMEACFTPEIIELAAKQKKTLQECKLMLKQRYDGYRFHPDGVSVYNPFSLLKAFFDKDFGSYWFATGTPTYLVKKLRETGFDVRKLTDKTLFASESMLSDYRADNPDLVPLLYQTGYLTITDYDSAKRWFTLGFPNEEVKYGFLESLVPEYVSGFMPGTGTDIFTLDNYVESGNLEGIKNILTALFAGIPYSSDDEPFEHYFQTVIYLIFTLLGKFVQCELHTWQGRIDCVLQTKQFIYLFEFKRDSSAEEAIRQIDAMGYALPFSADPRTLFRIGVNFDSSTRMLTDWKAD